MFGVKGRDGKKVKRQNILWKCLRISISHTATQYNWKYFGKKQRSLKIIPVCNCVAIWERGRNDKGYTINHLIKRRDRWRQTITTITTTQTTNFPKSKFQSQAERCSIFPQFYFQLNCRQALLIRCSRSLSHIEYIKINLLVTWLKSDQRFTLINSINRNSNRWYESMNVRRNFERVGSPFLVTINL